MKHKKYINNILFKKHNKRKNYINNKYIIFKINKQKRLQNKNIIYELKKDLPMLSNNKLLKIYNKCISLKCSILSNNGLFLEKEVIKFLDYHKISYKKQVPIDQNGLIIDNKINSYHVIDFVIGENIDINKSITKYIVLSCKTSVKDRWALDNWSFTLQPLKYILITNSNDYPSSNKFRESKIRKIITSNPKKNDDRIYKLEYCDLFNELFNYK
jgi:hypothetical protein